MKAWPGDLPVGMFGDLHARFSSVTGRSEFTIHIGILGLSEVCVVSWDKFTYFIWILGLSEVCAHNHLCGNINNDKNDKNDKTVDVENIVNSKNATENYVELEELFEVDKS